MQEGNTTPLKANGKTPNALFICYEINKLYCEGSYLYYHENRLL